jgi:anaphase-promoting complex subunit 3
MAVGFAVLSFTHLFRYLRALEFSFLVLLLRLPRRRAMAMEATLWSWAQHSLTHHLYDNAIFLAERLCAEAPSEPSRLLLANAYYASDQPARACAILSNCTAAENLYLLALCHMKLGRTTEAQRTLLGPFNSDPEGTAVVPNGAAGLYLLATACVHSQPAQTERARAIKYFSRALELNPFLWSAYEALAQLGAPLPQAPPAQLPPNPFSYIPLGTILTPGANNSATGGGTPTLTPACSATGGPFFPPTALTPDGIPICRAVPIPFVSGASVTPVRPFDSRLFSPPSASSPPSGIVPPGSGFHPGSMPLPPCNHGQAPRCVHPSRPRPKLPPINTNNTFVAPHSLHSLPPLLALGLPRTSPQMRW